MCGTPHFPDGVREPGLRVLTILSSERRARNFNHQRLPLTRPCPVIFALRTWAIWGRRKSILIMFICATIVSRLPHSSWLLFTVRVGRLCSFGGNYRKGHLNRCRFAVRVSHLAPTRSQRFRYQLIRAFLPNILTVKSSSLLSGSSGSYPTSVPFPISFVRAAGSFTRPRVLMTDIQSNPDLLADQDLPAAPFYPVSCAVLALVHTPD